MNRKPSENWEGYQCKLLATVTPRRLRTGVGHSALLMEKGKYGLWEFRVPKTAQAPKTKSRGSTVPSRAAASACACTETSVNSSLKAKWPVA